jgi:hypothetical protein
MHKSILLFIDLLETAQSHPRSGKHSLLEVKAINHLSAYCVGSPGKLVQPVILRCLTKAVRAAKGKSRKASSGQQPGSFAEEERNGLRTTWSERLSTNYGEGEAK